MKKIVLGCAAVLLSLGLLAGCNNDTDSAVTISVDNTATVVVGETLELPYTVEPEKAKVEVLNDHEEYVTADAKDGVLSLEGIAAGDATITLVGTYKKYTEANVDIKVSVVTEGEADQGPGPETGGSGNGYYFGFESDDVLYYITGDTLARGAYCGEVTTDINEAVEVTFEVDTEVENAYYISFKYEEEATYYITIIETENDGKTYINLSYATEKAPIYLHTDGEAEYFGDESGDYFLCYNATYGCLYASSVQQYLASSPVAGIYTASGELVAGGVGGTPSLPDIDPDADVITIGALRQGITDGTITDTSDAVTFYGCITARTNEGENNLYRGVYIQDGDDAVMLYSGCLETAWSELNLKIGDDIIVTATYSVYEGLVEMKPTAIALLDTDTYTVAEPVVWEPTSSEWSTAEASVSGRVATLDLIYNGGTISSTSSNTTLTFKFKDNESNTATVYLYSHLGTEALEAVKEVVDDLVVGDEVKITGVVAWYNGIQLAPHFIFDLEPADCFEVINTEAPESITISGEQEVTVGKSITLTATVSGTNADQHVLWSTTDTEYISVDETSGVVQGLEEHESVTVTATSRASSAVTAEYTIAVVAAIAGETEYSITITPESLAEQSGHTVSEEKDVSGNTYSYADGALTVAWAKDSGTGIKPWVSTSVLPTTIRIYASASFTVSNGTGVLTRIVIGACCNSTYDNYTNNLCGTSFSATGGTIGTATEPTLVSTNRYDDSVEITATSSSVTVTRSNAVCYCTGITLYYTLAA